MSDPIESLRRSSKQWKTMYKVWRDEHMDFSPEWRAKRVRGCIGKEVFRRQAEAENMMKGMVPKPGRKLNSYKCPICDMWHIGNSRFINQ